MKNNIGFSTIVSVLIVLGLFVVVGVAYKISKNNSVPTDVNQENTNSNVVENNEQNENEEVPVIIKTPLSTTLPEYIRGQEGWPPVITTSTKTYTCSDNLGQAPMGEVTVQKIINGRKFCVSSTIEAAAGSRYGNYLYTTAKDGGIKSTQFILKWPSCGVYGGPTDPTYKECQTQQDTFFANLDNLIDSLM